MGARTERWPAAEAKRGASNRLIVFAHVLVRADDGVHRLGHVAHAGLGDRALDHDHQFRLVRRRTHEGPSAVLYRHAHTVDSDEFADVLVGDFLTFLFGLLKLRHVLSDASIFGLVGP